MNMKFFLTVLAAAVLWGAAWTAAPAVSEAAGALFADERVAGAVAFFVLDTAKIFLLLVLMIYVLGWLRAGLSAERVRDALTGLNRGAGYVAGAVFGAVTPFCSCSSIPLFLGFTTAGIPLGITMSFLITSPLINEVAFVTLWGLLGPQLTLMYLAAGLLAGVVGGIVIDMIGAQRWLQPFVKQCIEAAGSGSAAAAVETQAVTAHDRHVFAAGEVKAILKRIWKWILIGVGVGAVLHGFVPAEWFADHLGNSWWTVPAAVTAGLPLYTNVTGVVPVMETLLAKGLPLGTVMAFVMSTAGASIPEFVMLRQVMTDRLLVIFFAILLIAFTLIGWCLNGFQTMIAA